MEFKITTLIDITETGERRGPDTVAVGQQANWDTLIQVIGLRVNPTPVSVKKKEGNISKLGFGSNYKGSHSYWEFIFNIEYGATNIVDLKNDFDLVPVIKNLTETIDLDLSVFHTKDSKLANIIFDENDK